MHFSSGTMRRVRRWLWVGFLFIVQHTLCATVEAARLALVVGVSEYRQSNGLEPLPRSTLDAELVARTLTTPALQGASQGVV